MAKETTETRHVEEQVESDSDTGDVENRNLGTTEDDIVAATDTPKESVTSSDSEVLQSKEPETTVASAGVEQGQEQVTPDISAEVQQSQELDTPAQSGDVGNNIVDDASDTIAEPGVDYAAKKYSKKNRNIKKVLITAKNKIETFQENNGGQANYLLLIEDNCTELPASGP